MTSALAAVRAALAGQARSTSDIARLTGLPTDVVSAAIDHLIQVGELAAEPLATGCPEEACGGCALAAHGCAGQPVSFLGRVRARSLRRVVPPATAAVG